MKPQLTAPLPVSFRVLSSTSTGGWLTGRDVIAACIRRFGPPLDHGTLICELLLLCNRGLLSLRDKDQFSTANLVKGVRPDLTRKNIRITKNGRAALILARDYYRAAIEP